jgi:hypothetical protein
VRRLHAPPLPSCPRPSLPPSPELGGRLPPRGPREGHVSPSHCGCPDVASNGRHTLANILSAGPQHPHGTYATSPHPRHLVPSAYASCLICLICPFATGPFSIFFAAGPTAIFYTAWLSGCMACARARSPPPSRHTPFCIPVGRQAPPVPPASHFFCLRCIYLLSVICLPFLLCVCPLTGLCRKSITCNCRASARRLPCPPYAPSV